MVVAGRINVMAGPFSATDFAKIIPADKKLSKEWIASLYARGEALSATGDDLKYIGMPISGICTGQRSFNVRCCLQLSLRFRRSSSPLITRHPSRREATTTISSRAPTAC